MTVAELIEIFQKFPKDADVFGNDYFNGHTPMTDNDIEYIPSYNQVVIYQELIMKRGEMLNNMIVLAATKHSGQYDKGGNPYFMHVSKVQFYLKSDDEELNCIALGHDIVEDTDVTYQELRDLGFSERVINGISCMTKNRGESYEEYKAKVKSNPDSIRVKMQDLRHNSDIRRLKGITEKDIRRIEKYHAFYMELKELV